MAIYRKGTASMDSIGVITGVGTNWKDALSLIRVGATIVFLTQPLSIATISAIVSPTELRAISTDGAVIPAGTNYVILIHDSITVDGLAQDVAETLRYYQSQETEIAEAIEFFKTFDLATLQALADQVQADAVSANDSKVLAEQAKDGSVVARNEAESFKNDAYTFKLESHASSQISETHANSSGASSASSAQSAADAEFWASQVNAQNLLHKDQNLSDLSDKDASRKNINAAIGSLSKLIPASDNPRTFLKDNPDGGFYSSGGSNPDLPPSGVAPGINTFWSYDYKVIKVGPDGKATDAVVVARLSTNSRSWISNLENNAWGAWTPSYHMPGGSYVVSSNPGATNILGDSSIAIGDSDTGIKWISEGLFNFYCNGKAIIGFNSTAIDVTIPIVNTSPGTTRAFSCSIPRAGDGGCIIAGQVGGGGHSEWMSRPAMTLMEIPNHNAAFSVWKATFWGYGHIANMDVVSFSSGSNTVRMNAGGGFFDFNSNGNAACVAWVSTSDIRLKAQLKEIKSASDKVSELVGYTYFKRNNLEESKETFYTEEAGLMAQDVAQVLPESVHKIGGTDYLGINYAGITALLVNAFKEMNDKIKSQASEIEKMRSDIELLINAVNELKSK
ncbi:MULTISPECIES: tail fiber domain-containing protein [Gammaproteobacteria]|uniref:tail fiber domain-containing protein n=1 Tax=Gammaproteobacteria TaxID=1236 RepID=UPI002FC86A7B